MNAPARLAIVRALALAALLLLAVIIGVRVGAVGMTSMDVLAALVGRGDATTRTIVVGLRLPRVAQAALAGAALALSGATLQSLFRNPLADPYTLGVSSGASVGAVAAITLGFAQRWAHAVSLCALAGALLTVAIVLRLAAAAGRTFDTKVLLLAGVIVGTFCNALVMLVLAFSDMESFRSAIFWMMGSHAGASTSSVLALGTTVLVGGGAVMALARPLNALALGERTASALGVHVRAATWTAIIASALLAAASVAASGVIAFVGLVAPHLVRLRWGNDYRTLLPHAALAGATLMVVADTIARVVVAPLELPVGVVTALVGVPVFLHLLLRRGANA